MSSQLEITSLPNVY